MDGRERICKTLGVLPYLNQWSSLFFPFSFLSFFVGLPLGESSLGGVSLPCPFPDGRSAVLPMARECPELMELVDAAEDVLGLRGTGGGPIDMSEGNFVFRVLRVLDDAVGFSNPCTFEEEVSAGGSEELEGSGALPDPDARDRAMAAPGLFLFPSDGTELRCEPADTEGGGGDARLLGEPTDASGLERSPKISLAMASSIFRRGKAGTVSDGARERLIGGGEPRKP